MRKFGYRNMKTLSRDRLPWFCNLVVSKSTLFHYPLQPTKFNQCFKLLNELNSVKGNPSIFKMHTQNLFQVPRIRVISRDQNGVFSKFDLEKTAILCRGSSLSRMSWNIFLLHSFSLCLGGRHKIGGKIRTSQYNVMMTSSKVVF